MRPRAIRAATPAAPILRLAALPAREVIGRRAAAYLSPSSFFAKASRTGRSAGSAAALRRMASR